jgi:hypothetical protein
MGSSRFAEPTSRSSTQTIWDGAEVVYLDLRSRVGLSHHPWSHRVETVGWRRWGGDDGVETMGWRRWGGDDGTRTRDPLLANTPGLDGGGRWRTLLPDQLGFADGDGRWRTVADVRQMVDRVG